MDYWAEVRTPEFQAQHQAKQSADIAQRQAKMAALAQREQERAEKRAAERAERDAFLQRVQANRAAAAAGQPIMPAKDIPRLAQMRRDEQAERATADRQREQEARQGMNDFVLHHLPRHDPKMVAYRQAIINPEGNTHA